MNNIIHLHIEVPEEVEAEVRESRFILLVLRDHKIKKIIIFCSKRRHSHDDRHSDSRRHDERRKEDGRADRYKRYEDGRKSYHRDDHGSRHHGNSREHRTQGIRDTHQHDDRRTSHHDKVMSDERRTSHHDKVTSDDRRTTHHDKVTSDDRRTSHHDVGGSEKLERRNDHSKQKQRHRREIEEVDDKDYECVTMCHTYVCSGFNLLVVC